MRMPKISWPRLRVPSEGFWIVAAIAACLVGREGALYLRQLHPGANEFSISQGGEGGDVRFALDRTDMGRHVQWVTSLPGASLEGLEVGQMGRLEGRKTFRLDRHVGSFLCEGEFRRGVGRGSYTFTPSASYLRELKELGYREPEEREWFQLAIADVPIEMLRAVRQAGLAADWHDAMDLQNHGYTAVELRAVTGAGYPGLSKDELVALKNHGVGAAMLAAVKRAGFDYRVSEIVALRNHGVTAEYLRDLASVEPKLSAEEMIQFHNHGLGARFVTASMAEGFRFAPGDWIRLHQDGVNGEYLANLKQAGFGHLEARQIIELHRHGIR